MLRDANYNYFKNIYIICGHTDQRYGIDSLAAIITTSLLEQLQSMVRQLENANVRLDNLSNTNRKNSVIGRALAYSIDHEKYLRVFLTDGSVPPDNNYAEQEIQPFAIGRNNFDLKESDNGAKASAILYSLVETAKANGVKTYQYLNLLLTEITKHMNDDSLNFLDELLLWSQRVQKECPNQYKKK